MIYDAQNRPMDIVMVAFLRSRQCYNGYLTAVSIIAHFKTIVNFLPYLKHTISMHVSVSRHKYNVNNL